MSQCKVPQKSTRTFDHFTLDATPRKSSPVAPATEISRGQFSGISQEQTCILNEALDYHFRAYNIFVQTHREGSLNNLNNNLRDEFGEEALTNAVHSATIKQAILDARESLTHVRKGLRRKSADRMKKIRPVGPLKGVMDQLLAQHQISPDAVIESLFRWLKLDNQWILDATIKGPLPTGVREYPIHTVSE